MPGDARGPVLGLGDSITCGPEEGAFGIAPRPWAQWLAEALDLPFHRLAQAGATTPWIAAELLPRARTDYALACVHVGTNDVRARTFPAAAYETALRRIIETLSQRAHRVCVATVPTDLGRPRAGDDVATCNTIVRRLAADHGAVVVGLDDLRGWRLMLPDAVHPTARGQLEIAHRAAEALRISRVRLPAPGAQGGLRADVRYATCRQLAHLARDWRRRALEQGPGRGSVSDGEGTGITP